MAFENVEIEWGGRVYTVVSSRVMRMLALMEEHLTFTELETYSAKGTVPLAKLAMVYGTVLRYAGCKISDEDVYAKLFDDDVDTGAAIIAVTKVMAIMLPPARRKVLLASLNGETSGDAAEEPLRDTSEGNQEPAAAASSRKRTRRQSENKVS